MIKQYRISMAILSIVLFIVEFQIATTFKHLPIVRGYFGDFLVVILLYTIVQAIRPMKPLIAGAGIFLFSLFVEFMQMLEPAKLLGFAIGSAGEIILGSTFSPEDILMYFCGTVTIVLFDMIFHKLNSDRK